MPLNLAAIIIWSSVSASGIKISCMILLKFSSSCKRDKSAIYNQLSSALPMGKWADGS